METTHAKLDDQVQIAVANYADLQPTPLDSAITPETFHLATPDRLAYALGWIVANQIVQARFLTSGIDVLPVFHPEHGWDRFLISRRVSGVAFEHKPANEFGMLVLSGEDAPRFTSPGGKARIALRTLLQENAEQAVQSVLNDIPQPPLDTSNENRIRVNERAPDYPLYYQIVTDLILTHPGLVASREIYVDDEEIDGQYHPLYLHAAELTSMGPEDRTGMNMATMTYNWFQLQTDEVFAFFDRRGTRAIYRTDRSTWSRVRIPLTEESPEEVRNRILGWLRLEGKQPHPERD